MNKETFKKTQPVAFRLLSRTLKTGNISHAYLLHGPKGAPAGEIALLFVQSLFCTHPDRDGFACQECDECRQTAAQTNPDFYRIGPGSLHQAKPLTRKQIEQAWKEGKDIPAEKKTAARYRILKEDILRLQDSFSFQSGRGRSRAYIIEQYENATPEASNSLLKFLEEPEGGLVGILTAQKPSAILPTILSRCQLIPVRQASRAVRKEQFEAIVDDDLLCETFAAGGYTAADAQDLSKNVPVFSLAQAAEEYWREKESHTAVVRLQLEVFSRKNKELEKNLSAPAVRLFLEMLLVLSSKEKMTPKILEQRTALLESLDALQRPVDPALLLDHVCSEILRIEKTQDMEITGRRGNSYD